MKLKSPELLTKLSHHRSVVRRSMSLLVSGVAKMSQDGDK